MSPPASGTILVIDDHRDSREMLCALLGAAGYACETAEGGDEAFRLLQSGLAPAVIILDVVMPDMSGQEFRQRQLADDRFAGILVIAYSGVAHLDEECRRLGIPGLRKPGDPQEMLALVAQYVGLRERE